MVLRSVRAARFRRQGLGTGGGRPEGRAGLHGPRRTHHPRARPGTRSHPALRRQRPGRGLRGDGLEISRRGGADPARARRAHRADRPRRLSRPPGPYGGRGRNPGPKLPRLRARARGQRGLQSRPDCPGDRGPEREAGGRRLSRKRNGRRDGDRLRFALALRRPRFGPPPPRPPPDRRRDEGERDRRGARSRGPGRIPGGRDCRARVPDPITQRKDRPLR